MRDAVASLGEVQAHYCSNNSGSPLEEKGVEKMSDQSITLHLEISAEVGQQDVWDLEEQLGQVAGITTELREPKDLLAATLLFIQVAGPYIGQAVTVAGGINTIHDLAQTIYHFLHPKKQKADRQQEKTKVVFIITKGKRIELYNLSSVEIEKIIEQEHP